MQAELPVQVSVGGLGCKMCRYWNRYSEGHSQMLKLNTSWGRCLNSEVSELCSNSPEEFLNSSNARINVDIEYLTDDIMVVSTGENHRCEYFRGKT